MMRDKQIRAMAIGMAMGINSNEKMAGTETAEKIIADAEKIYNFLRGKK